MSASGERPDDVIAFWRAVGPSRWYNRDDELDRDIAARFADLHARAAAGDLDDWAKSADGSLALLILLDQFSRNMFRGSARAFAQDAKAREIAKAAISSGFHQKVPPELTVFFYLPFMHSESIADQDRSVALCHSLPDGDNLPYARDHERIIRRFGRFPHRNPALGRHTSPAEQAFLDAGGFSG